MFATDTRFHDAALELARRSGLFRDPRLDTDEGQLVEGELRVDLLNAWHLGNHHPETGLGFLETLFAPASLVEAAAYGRLDVVRHAIADQALDRGVPAINAAIAAFVVTDLHVTCVEALYAAGVPFHASHEATFAAESVGLPNDARLLALMNAARSR
ncbi:MAG: hypothetical protein SFW67_36410 [Myxococcaceae bacterium]|nr:hypothetical protein [Myxococcaceae bacterium]